MTSSRQYRCAEAFCLMRYRSDDGAEEELIWNSRDGVTPFVVRSMSGKEMRHVEWHRDHRMPDYTPQPGSRVFVDMTPKQCRRWGVPVGAPRIVTVTTWPAWQP